jgi:hypothetical protein
MSMLDEVIGIANDYARGEADTDAVDTWLARHADELAPPAGGDVTSFVRSQLDALQGGYLGEDEARAEVQRYLAEHGLLEQGVASQA